MDEQLIEAARNEAATAGDHNRLEQVDRAVEGILRDRGPSALESVKQPLRQARSPRMRTCTFYRCDKCNQAILNVDEGFIIHGNVYVADPSCRGGLIGNNFPNVRPGDKIEVEDIRENVFCHNCLVSLLKLDEKLATDKIPLLDESTPVASGTERRRRRPMASRQEAIVNDEVMRQLREMS